MTLVLLPCRSPHWHTAAKCVEPSPRGGYTWGVGDEKRFGTNLRGFGLVLVLFQG